MAEENQINPEPAVTPLAEVIEQEIPDGIGSGSAEEDAPGRSSRGRRGRENATASRATGGEMLHQAKKQFQTFKENTDTYVRNNPTKAVFTALGIGFVLGLMRRR